MDDSATIEQNLQAKQQDILEPLRALHRGAGYSSDDGSDSYVTFARVNKAGDFENLFSLTVEELNSNFSRAAEFLTHDAYFSVNGLYRTAPFLSDVTGLPGVWRQEKHLRYLNACYLDLDVGRDPKSGASDTQCLTVDDASQKLLVMIRDGSLLNPSMSARSGRGLYLFWFLRDDNANQNNCPPRAY